MKWALVLAVAATTLILYFFNVFERLELLTLDYRFILNEPKISSSDIVFIEMGEDSIANIGRWPWPRKWHASLIRALSDYHPKAIAFDVLFSEPQDDIDDSALEAAIGEAGNVYLPLLYNLKEQRPEALRDPQAIFSIIPPLSRFEKYIKGTGHINAIPDPDGILRRVPPVITYQGKAVYQLGFKIGFDALGLKDGDISFDPKAHAIYLKIKDAGLKRIPLDSNNQFIINWTGRWGKEFKHYSYIDVLKSYAAVKEGRPPIIDLNEFRNKICLIGLTAAGLIDIKPIPIENAYPAIGINAAILYDVINNKFIYTTPASVDILLIILLSLFVTLYLSNTRLLGGTLLATIGMAGYALSSLALFKFFNIAVLTFYPMLAIFLSYSLASVYTNIMQSIERTRLFKQATRDGLTSLYNIRHFNLLLETELKNASLYKRRRFALIMADIDDFKSINDNYGHRAGDIILRAVARIIETKCRQTDVVARYGGEEFIVMLTGAGEMEALEIAEKIRSVVSGKRFRFRNAARQITISLGIAEFSGEKKKEELIEKADRALYKAKHEGKNRVCLCSGSGP